MKKIIKLGLLGSGTVGTGVVRVLNENKEDIVQKIGADIEIKKSEKAGEKSGRQRRA